jgi:UDP-3-O-[3-hydroxymyristoyl] glucosamine N-acyltransferase
MEQRLLPHMTQRGIALRPVSAAIIARRVDGLLEGDSSRQVFGAAPLRVATRDDLAFWTLDTWVGDSRTAQAGILLAVFGIQGTPPPDCVVIQVADPYAAMALLLKEFHEPLIAWPEPKIAWDANIHPTAVVEGTIWPGAQIGPHCVVPQGSEVGWNTVLEANVTLYPGARLGSDCVIQAGVVIGARGFGFRAEGDRRIAVPHYAGVEIGDRVRIGANSVVSSGFLESTRIGDESCLDSFVQIAHHCQVGRRVMMASGSGLSGGVLVGDGVEFGGAAQVAQHVRIGEGARIAAKSGVSHDVPAGAVFAGFPAEPIASWKRAIATLRKLSSRDS